ncbi:HAD family hydrolase [Hamadaea tsunoensis]|uniref:HAD family hydrolase n=1 Tax=Hamadaea tsunoensis TaxID=53368 RepID=UPI000427113D|nr:HAD family hydrolase [Hamadaea tsunoensis]
MSGFRVVATDLDGTLLRSDLTVSARTRSALAALPRHGVRHLVVTGRQMAGCRDLLAGLGYRGLAVCGQGTQLYDADTGRLVWSTTLDIAAARAAADRIRRAYAPVWIGVATAGPAGHILVEPGFYSRASGDCVAVPAGELWAGPIEKVFVRSRAVPAADLAEGLAALCGDAFTVTHAHPTVVELLPPGVTKAHGLTLAADRLGFAAADTIAFGDMPNDIPMFAWSGYGVAMGNGDPRVLAAADEVGPGNDDDGVAAVLERLWSAS